jgi:hypothetical protein
MIKLAAIIAAIALVAAILYKTYDAGAKAERGRCEKERVEAAIKENTKTEKAHAARSETRMRHYSGDVPERVRGFYVDYK